MIIATNYEHSWKRTFIINFLGCSLDCKNNGSCTLSLKKGEFICKCPPSFAGDRCQTDMCDGHCLNTGRCRVEERDNTVGCE